MPSSAACTGRVSEQFYGETSGGPPRKYYRVTPQDAEKLGERDS